MHKAADTATRATRLEHLAPLLLAVVAAALDNSRVLVGLEPVEALALLLVLHPRLVHRLRLQGSDLTLLHQTHCLLGRSRRPHYSVNRLPLQHSLAVSAQLVTQAVVLVARLAVLDLELEVLLVVEATFLEEPTSNNRASPSEADLVLDLVRPQARQVPSVALRLRPHPSEEPNNSSNNLNRAAICSHHPLSGKTRIRTKLNRRLAVALVSEPGLTNNSRLVQIHLTPRTRTQDWVSLVPTNNSSNNHKTLQAPCSVINNKLVTLVVVVVVVSLEINNNKNRSPAAYSGRLRIPVLHLVLVSSKTSKEARSSATRTSSNRSQISLVVPALARFSVKTTTWLARRTLPLPSAV